MAVAPPARLLRALPGRARFHLAGWRGEDASALSERIRGLSGVVDARAEPRTRNVLVRYEPAEADAEALAAQLGALVGDVTGPAPPRGTPSGPRAAPRSGRPPPLGTPSGPPNAPRSDRPSPRTGRRAHIALSGLRHDPDLGRRAVERLEALPAVRRASASPLTGRVFVELVDAGTELEDVVAELGDLGSLDGEEQDIPGHPLDPGPLIEGAARLAGAGLGLTLLAVRRASGAAARPVAAQAPANVAAALGLAESLPPVADRTEALLGHERKELLFGAIGIASMSLCGGALGLALAGATGLQLLTATLARRSAWREYERRVDGTAGVYPGARRRLEADDRVPLPARVIEGFGTAESEEGMPEPVAPGARLPSGARLYGGPFVVELEADGAITPQPRPRPPRPSPEDRYVSAAVVGAMAYAGVTAVLTRSPARALTALLLVNPRPAMVGAWAAEMRATERLVRTGATVVGARPGHRLRRPDRVVLDCPRLLTDGFELAAVRPLHPRWDAGRAREVAAQIAAAAGSPWGPAFPPPTEVRAVDGTFDGRVAGAELDGERWVLEPATGAPAGGRHELQLRRQAQRRAVAELALRPRPAVGLRSLRSACRRRGVTLTVAARAPSDATRQLARRAQVKLDPRDTLEIVRDAQRTAEIVAVVGDGAAAAAALDAADLAIGLSSGRSGPFPAGADVLAPALASVGAVVKAGARRDAAARDAVGIALAANLAGAVWGLWRRPPFAAAARPAQIGGLAAICADWLRLHGGHPPRSVARRISDPRPERWGRLSPETVLEQLGSSTRGLSREEAAARRRPRAVRREQRSMPAATADQLRSPLVVVLAAGAALSLATGALGDVALIASVIVANAMVGTWQEQRAGRALEALDAVGSGVADVVRGGRPRRVGAHDVVPGDILLLAPGVRVAADARVLAGESLEVDEAALTGESLPVRKLADSGIDATRVVLEGSDVTSGSGRAVAVAVGEGTRMGSLAAALADDGRRRPGVDDRLRRIVRVGLPLIALAGGVVTALGVLRGQALVPQLVLGSSIAIAAVPEGLPLLAGAAEAGVARRLAYQGALVSRLASVEALGRVDVACVDKTGTLTEGRLAVTRVADAGGLEGRPPRLERKLRRVLAVAAMASPHPDASDATAHQTDAAVLRSAVELGLADEARVERQTQVPFDAARSYAASLAGGRLHVKGAAEVVVRRCTRVRRDGAVTRLDEAGRRALLERARAMAAEGLRVLVVAERDGGAPEDPRKLTAVGLLGMGDPLRASVPAAVRRCREAGVRVVMLTGDHPATAQAIAADAGLNGDPERVITGAEIASLGDGELLRRLDRVTVVARSTPLDKVRIVEALGRGGHVVAMTGDGINDAPALRLADVGVAIGARSTEVARQAADLVVAGDDFGTLVEALVEGRGFWRNLRRALGLLLGGNAGEVGLVVAAGLAGMPAPLTARQILAVNLVTDVLPAVAVAVQEPEHRNLAGLDREGAAALDRPLRDDILRRAVATALPSFAAYAAALASGGGQRTARSVAYISVITTQLAQTLDLGRSEGRLTAPVLGAVGGSLGVLALTFLLPPVRAVLGLGLPGAGGLVLSGGASIAAVALASGLGPRPAARLSTTDALRSA